jgi:hypothetical protein
MSNDLPPPILKGTYTSNSGMKLQYEVNKVTDDLFSIYFTNGKSPALAELFPVWKGQWFNVNNADFKNFKDKVVNNPLESWIVTKLSDGQKVQIPGTWTTETSGGKKRSDKKRSDKKRSGHKRSDKRRKSHKRSGHKRRKSHKRSGHKRP